MICALGSNENEGNGRGVVGWGEGKEGLKLDEIRRPDGVENECKAQRRRGKFSRRLGNAGGF